MDKFKLTLTAKVQRLTSSGYVSWSTPSGESEVVLEGTDIMLGTTKLDSSLLIIDALKNLFAEEAEKEQESDDGDADEKN